MRGSGPGPRLSLSLALLAAVAITWPLAAAPFTDAFVGHPVGDLADHVQGAWWWAAEVWAGRFPDTTTLTHAPEARPLWYVDPVGALLALPLWGLGAPAAWNLALLVQVLGAAAVAWACGRDLTDSPSAGLVAAVVAAPSP